MIVDLFAGAGGWDLGARWAGLPDPMGLERYKWACATRLAAGMPTYMVDVTKVHPGLFDGVHGLIASPPCPAFSNAGNKGGLDDIATLCEVAWETRVGDIINMDRYEHEESWLCLIPLLWALWHRPRWVVLEQVPAVLPVWRAIANRLEDELYSTWTGILHSEKYGVPQTRDRAFMLATLDRYTHPPQATHQQYTYGAPAEEIPAMFGATLLPWISMGQALELAAVELDTRCTWLPDPMSMDVPAPTVTTKAVGESQWVLRHKMGQGFIERHGDRRPSGMAEPAKTIDAGVLRRKEWVLQPGGGGYENAHRRPYDLDEPAPTVAFGKDINTWVWERPATTVAADGACRIFTPGGHTAHDGRDLSKTKGRSEDAIPVQPWQAGVLQSFPAAFPWKGPKTAQGRQIGNAVPPLLAQAVLQTVAC